MILGFIMFGIREVEIACLNSKLAKVLENVEKFITFPKSFLENESRMKAYLAHYAVAGGKEGQVFSGEDDDCIERILLADDDEAKEYYRLLGIVFNEANGRTSVIDYSLDKIEKELDSFDKTEEELRKLRQKLNLSEWDLMNGVALEDLVEIAEGTHLTITM